MLKKFMPILLLNSLLGVCLWRASAYQTKKAISISTTTEHKGEKVTDIFTGVKEGNIESVRRFLEKGGDVNLRNKEHFTLLIHACTYGQKETVALLLKQNARINDADNDGKSAIFYSVSYGNADGVLAKILLDNGANPNLVDRNGNTPLFDAVDVEASLVTAKALLQAGARANAKNKSGDTPLRISISWGFEKIADLLLQSGADVNGQRNDGWTPLMEAAAGGHLTIVKMLIAKGATVNKKDKSGKTALDAAKEANSHGVESIASKNRAEIIQLLENHQN
jgi:uncharacterized protein